MTKFHSDDYIKFLRSIRPDNMSEYNKQMQRCKYLFKTYFLFCSSCFIFDVLYYMWYLNEFMLQLM